jgi:hypothetical protein
VVLTLTFWRPQRKPIPDSEGVGGDACLHDSPPCEWVDIGGLEYSAYPPAAQQTAGSGPAAPPCPMSAFSTSDPELKPESALVAPDGHLYGDAGVRDLAPDRGADASKMLTFSVDVTRCLEAHSLAWSPPPQEIRLVGTNRFDRAEQRLQFTLR